ncbi:hypothetical protein LA080_002418 [Diaporthe eres]|nr:hypothetical protein LA080_002418 [Diaporthe eres]
MTLAVTDALTFDQALPYLASGVLPRLFAPNGNRARIRIQAALAEYYRQHKVEEDFAKQTAEITLLRHRVFRSLGFKDSEIGRMELTMVFASTNNSVPLIFWIILNAFARPGVVETLRAEVQGVIDIVPVKEEQEAVWKSGGKTATLRKANARASLLTDEARCPYLAAIQREVLRLCNTTTGFRHAMRDTTLPDGTCLQAGSTVHIPTSISHRLPEVWGPADPNEFEPARWIKTTPGTNGLIKSPAAYFHLVGANIFAQDGALHTLRMLAFS